MKRYQIRVEGHLGSDWSERLKDWDLANQDSDTLLEGSLTDQAALQGLFKVFRDAGISIVSVNPVSASKEE